MENTKKVLLNEGFTLEFITNVSDYEKVLVTLRRLGYKVSYEDVTKENQPLHYAEGRAEVVLNVAVKDVIDAAFVKSVIRKSN